jgi:hypothetical protein
MLRECWEIGNGGGDILNAKDVLAMYDLRKAEKQEGKRGIILHFGYYW